MSTKYVFPLPEEQEQEPTAQQIPDDETHAVNVDGSAAFLRRIPAGVFIVAYGALLVGIFVGGMMLVDHEASAEDTAQTATVPAPPPPGPAPQTLDDVRESVRPNLITDTAAAQTRTGVILTGRMTPLAEENLADFAGHVSRLLEQTCLDNFTVTSQDNLKINLWGYCFQSPGQEAIQSYVGTALTSGAATVSISNYPWREPDQVMIMSWFEDSDEDAEAVARGFARMKPVGGVKEVVMYAYGPENVHIRDHRSGMENAVWPRGQALQKSWNTEPLTEREP